MTNLINKYLEILVKFGQDLGMTADLSATLAEVIAFLSLIILGVLLYFLARFLINKTVYVLIRRTPSKYDDLLIKNKVLVRICLLIPAILLKYFTDETLPSFPDTVEIIIKIVKIYEIITYTAVLLALVNTAHDLYNSFEMSKLKPIEGLVQVTKGVLYAVCVLLITAFLLGKSVSTIVIGLGPDHQHEPRRGVQGLGEPT